MSGDPLVALRGVSFSYPLPGGGRRPALRDVSLEVGPGETLLVLGANGAGKSTLAALLAGVEQPTGGTVDRAAAAPEDSPPVLPAGLVTQNPEDCFSSPIVSEEMGVVLENLERDPSEIGRAVAAMLAEIGLAGHADVHPALLSGGQKQLLAIASVLIAEPPLLLLDEPLTLLDGPGRAEVERLLGRRRGSAASTVYLTSEVGEAARADRLVVLHRGAIVWEGAPDDLPQDAAILGAWGLVLPDLAVLGAALHASGRLVSPPRCDPEELARRAVSCAAGPLTVGFPPAAAQHHLLGVCGQAKGDRLLHPGGGAFQTSRMSSHGNGDGEDGIAITGLHFTYDPGTPRARQVLRGIELAAHPGEVLGIVGAIGSGKTTLLQHINGLLPPQRGRVAVGRRVLEPGARIAQLLHREVGLVFQFPEKQLFAESVDEDVAAGPEFAGVAEEEIPGRVRAALERVGLDPAEYGPRAPYDLTWGEKRLVAIAGVLVLETPHLILDEPGAGLDPAGRRSVMDLLAGLAHREGRSVVVVSHHLDDLFRVADRIAVLHEGRIVFAGTLAELCRQGDPERWGLSWPPLLRFARAVATARPAMRLDVRTPLEAAEAAGAAAWGIER